MRHVSLERLTHEDEMIWKRFLERTQMWSINLLSKDHFNDDEIMISRTNLIHLKSPIAKHVAMEFISRT